MAALVQTVRVQMDFDFVEDLAKLVSYRAIDYEFGVQFRYEIVPLLAFGRVIVSQGSIFLRDYSEM